MGENSKVKKRTNLGWIPATLQKVAFLVKWDVVGDPCMVAIHTIKFYSCINLWNILTPVVLEEDEDQSLKLALRQPRVWIVSDFIFLATAYEGGWPVLSLNIWQRMVSVLIIAELARGASEAEISKQISTLAGVWTPNLTVGSPAR